MGGRQWWPALVVSLALLGACGDDDSGAADGEASGTAVEVEEPTSTTTTAAPTDIDVDASWQSPPDRPSEEACRAAEPDCIVTLGTATYRGTFSGTSTYRSEAWPTPEGLDFTTEEVFTGEVEGCGEGTVTWRLEGVIAGTAINDVWTVEAGSGTGDLVGLTGDGTQTGRFEPDQSYGGDMSGTLRCRAAPASG